MMDPHQDRTSFPLRDRRDSLASLRGLAQFGEVACRGTETSSIRENPWLLTETERTFCRPVKSQAGFAFVQPS